MSDYDKKWLEIMIRRVVRDEIDNAVIALASEDRLEDYRRFCRSVDNDIEKSGRLNLNSDE